MKFEDYVQKYILNPLNMASTGFAFTEEVVQQMATGYLDSNGDVADLIDLGNKFNFI